MYTGSDLAFPVEPTLDKESSGLLDCRWIEAQIKLPVVCGMSTPHFGSGSAANTGADIKMMMGKALSTLVAAIMGAASAWLISRGAGAPPSRLA
jgi:hypothetical protein